MPLAKQLTDFERGQIVALKSTGLSHQKIAIEIKRSKSAVTYFLANRENHGKIKRSGRPPKVTPRDRRSILRLASNTGASSAKIKDTLNLPYHRSTVKRVLNNSPNHNYCKRKGKPPLKPIHKIARLEWAKSHMEFGGKWRTVVWSDEKKFNLDGPDGVQYYWADLRNEREIFSKNAMGGGSVMVWDGFSWDGTTDIVFIDGRLNSAGYREVLENHLLPKATEIAGQNWIFQQDNASIHTARAILEWFRTDGINPMKWPARSPDLNPIENLWGILVRRVYANGRQFNAVGDLKEAIREEWSKISAAIRHNLINSMPNRVFNVILKTN